MNAKRLMADEAVTISGASRIYGVADQTLRSAIERGDLKTYKLACGYEVLHARDVELFAQGRPKRGPKLRPCYLVAVKYRGENEWLEYETHFAEKEAREEVKRCRELDDLFKAARFVKLKSNSRAALTAAIKKLNG